MILLEDELFLAPLETKKIQVSLSLATARSP